VKWPKAKYLLDLIEELVNHENDLLSKKLLRVKVTHLVLTCKNINVTTICIIKREVPDLPSAKESFMDLESKNESEIKKRTIQAFRQAYEANIAIIYRYIYRRVGNREEAEDLTAQVFEKSLQSTDWNRESASIRSWLLQIARTTLADHWRNFYRIRTTSLDTLLDTGWDNSPDENHWDEGPAKQMITMLLEQLPENQAKVLQCRFLWNYSIRETATHLGLTEANIKVIQYRALKHASELWGTLQNTILMGVPNYE
jgi:RNA polymerase sigma-70 factor (ECF subfamily)